MRFFTFRFLSFTSQPLSAVWKLYCKVLKYVSVREDVCVCVCVCVCWMSL